MSWRTVRLWILGVLAALMAVLLPPVCYFGYVLLTGGEPPRNADPADLEVYRSLEPKVSRISWDRSGRIDTLEFVGEKISDEEFRQIVTLKELWALGFVGCSLEEGCLRLIARLTKLSGLDLQSSDVRDAELADLRECPNLSILILTHTAISDKGLRLLSENCPLERLDIEDTQISESAVEEFRTSNPDCAVVQKSSAVVW